MKLKQLVLELQEVNEAINFSILNGIIQNNFEATSSPKTQSDSMLYNDFKANGFLDNQNAKTLLKDLDPSKYRIDFRDITDGNYVANGILGSDGKIRTVVIRKM